jgi:phage-related protein (TIGR01555 family)
MERKPKSGISIVNQTRKDFMGAGKESSKATIKDPLARHRPTIGVRLTDREITDLYETNQIFQNIIDVVAEDMMREFIEIEECDPELAKQIMDKLTALKAQQNLKEMIKYERLRGVGFCSIGTTQQIQATIEGGNNYILDQPLDTNNILDIEYIQAFSRQKVQKGDQNMDVFSPHYGELEYVTLKSTKDISERKIHMSRLLTYMTRETEDDMFPAPLIKSLYDPLTVFDNAAWSTGQLFYNLVTKVLKSPDINLNDIGENGSTVREQIINQLQFEFNSMTLSLIGKDDELSYLSSAGSVGSAIEAMYTFCWEYLAGSARMPKSHILGQQQGTITGGQYDSLNYYCRIAGLQENYLRPCLEYLINLLLLAKNSGVGKGSIQPTGKYKLKFKPLWKLDKETDAKIRKTVAEVDKIYYDIQAVTSDEIRQTRFKLDPMGLLLEEGDVEPGELDELAQKVEDARVKANKPGGKET